MKLVASEDRRPDTEGSVHRVASVPCYRHSRSCGCRELVVDVAEDCVIEDVECFCAEGETESFMNRKFAANRSICLHCIKAARYISARIAFARWQIVRIAVGYECGAIDDAPAGAPAAFTYSGTPGMRFG